MPTLTTLWPLFASVLRPDSGRRAVGTEAAKSAAKVIAAAGVGAAARVGAAAGAGADVGVVATVAGGVATARSGWRTSLWTTCMPTMSRASWRSW